MPSRDGSLTRFRTLPAAERRIAWRAACRLSLIQPVLAIAGPRPLLTALTRRPLARCGRARLEPGRIVWLVEAVAARLPWPTTCLGRAVTAAHLLLVQGWSCDLIIGAVPADRPFAAHAWIEHEGRVMGPPGKGCEPIATWHLPGADRA